MKYREVLFLFAANWLCALHSVADDVISMIANVVDYSEGGVRIIVEPGEVLVQNAVELNVIFPEELKDLRVSVMTSEEFESFWENSVGKDVGFSIPVEEFKSLLELKRQRDSGNSGAYWALRQPDLYDLWAIPDRIEGKCEGDSDSPAKR